MKEQVQWGQFGVRPSCYSCPWPLGRGCAIFSVGQLFSDTHIQQLSGTFQQKTCRRCCVLAYRTGPLAQLAEQALVRCVAGEWRCASSAKKAAMHD